MFEGEGQIILATTFSESRNAYDARGWLTGAPSYRKFETQAYIEYGALEWLTIVGQTSVMNFHGGASSPAFEAASGAPLSIRAPPGLAYAGPGAGSLGARLRVLEVESYAVSLEASLRAATRPAQRFADFGNELQGDVRLQLGHGIDLFGIPGFYDAQIGYRTRGQRGVGLRVDVTFGLRPLDDVLLLAQSFSALTKGKTREDFAYSHKFQLSAVYDLTSAVSLQLGALASLAGVNSSSERGVVGALWFRFHTSQPASKRTDYSLY